MPDLFEQESPLVEIELGDARGNAMSGGGWPPSRGNPPAPPPTPAATAAAIATAASAASWAASGSLGGGRAAIFLAFVDFYCVQTTDDSICEVETGPAILAGPLRSQDLLSEYLGWAAHFRSLTVGTFVAFLIY